jgi:hypothetical protein
MSHAFFRRLAQAPRFFAAILFAFHFVAAPKAGAQGDARSITVSFASASARANGFLHGTIRLQYRFDSCGDLPQLYFALERGSAQGFEGYWYEGKFYGLKSSWLPPTAPALTAAMHVTFGGRPVPVSDLNNPYVGPISCSSGSQWRTLGKWTDFVQPGGKREDALTRFSLAIESAREPMRSPDVESQIRAEIAAATRQARTDSISKAQQARKDSIARASQASATRSAPTAAAAPGGAASPSQAGQGDIAPVDEQAQADARARTVVAQIEAQQAANAARDAQVEAAATQVAGMVAGIIEQNRIEKERRAARAAEAAANYERYKQRVAAIFAALPPRPACVPGDTAAASVAIGESRSGQMLGSECRLANQTSAEMYALHITRRMKVEVEANAAFYAAVSVTRAAGGAPVLPSGGSRVEGFLEPGSYTVIVATRLPGETGAYTLRVGKGTLSRVANASIGLFMGPVSGAWTGAAEMPQPGTVGGLRVTLPLAPAFHFVGEGVTADGETLMNQLDAGARVYLRNRTVALRPVVQWTYGWREIFIDRSFTGDFYNGKGSTLSFGVEWFTQPGISLDISLAKVTGIVNIKEPSAASPTVDYSHTALRFGLMLHK